MKLSQDIIIKPIITEKTMDMLADKRYVFKVAPDATKPEIAKAVEEMFGVEVASVNTISMKKKPKDSAFTPATEANGKKAIVALKPSSKTIAFFDSMN